MRSPLSLIRDRCELKSDNAVPIPQEFQQALKDNHIVVIHWRDLQKLVNEK